MPQVVGCKDGTLADERIGRLAQEFHVAGIVVVFPQVGGEPWASHGIEVPRHVLVSQRRGEAEDVARDGGGPATCTEVGFGCTFTRLLQRADKVDEGLYTFAQTCAAGGPVVHLQVDVVVVVHVPRAIHLIGPDALQVGREVAWTAGGDEQVAAKLVVERFEVVVCLPFAVVLESLRGGDIRCFRGFRCGVECQLHTLEEGLVVGQMILQQAVVAQFAGLVHPSCRGGRGVDAYVGERVVEIGVEVDFVVGISCDEEGHFVSLLHDEASIVGTYATTGRQGGHANGIGHLVVVQTGLVAERLVAIRLHGPFTIGVGRIAEG